MSNFGEQPISSERNDFDENQASLEEKKKAIAEAAAAGDFDKIAALAQEAKSLEGKKDELVGNAQEEAEKEDNERKMYDEAKAEDAERAMYDEAAAEDAAREQMKFAEETRLKAEEDAKKAAEILKKIQGGDVEKTQMENTETMVAEKAEPVNPETLKPEAEQAESKVENAETAKAELASVEELAEKLGTPESEMSKQYGEKMRQAADKLLTVVKSMRENEEKLKEAEYKSPEWQKLWDENRALNDRRNELDNDASWGGNIMRLRGQSGNESWSDHQNYLSGEHDKYRKAAMNDPYVALRMVEAGQLGFAYQTNEGIGKINDRLLSNPEFMSKVLDLMSPRQAEGFWAHARGAANNRELYVAAVKKNHLNYQWGRSEWKRDPEIQQIALDSGLYEAYLDKGH